MDSSDDDKPIAQLAARAMHSKPSSAPAAMTIPKQAVRTAPAAPGAKRPAAEIDSDDDDVPLAVLMKRKLEAAQKTTMKTPSKMIKTAPPPKKAKVDMSSKNPSRKAKDAKSSKKSKAKPSKSSRSSAASAVGQSSRVSVYYESEKGKVVQALMLRWWYAIQWPELNTRMTVPPGYESLDGFPGVFVGTRLDNFGEIRDLRNKSTCPNFKNLWAKSTEELKGLCETAIREQIKQLVDAEGPDTALERSLVRELK
ncbi:unnamed protein product, partial [Ectocarpus fasciculatus]